MHRRRVPLLVSLLLVAATVVARADGTDDYIKAQMEAFHLPGLSLVVIRDGQIVKVAGYGLANVERKTPATPETVYKIGSVSKQFIATGIMLLVQEGRLGLDDPISKFLDGTPPAWTPITIRHLLTHTSGLIRESPAFDPFKVKSDAEVLKAAYDLPLHFAPGQKWQYCNTGYFALAEIIRRVTNQPWTDYLNDKVFRPSGMSSTFPTNAKGVPLMALGYAGNDNRRKADDWPALRPSGAFLSTVLDLAKWDAVLSGDGVLRDATRLLMWTPVRLTDGTSAPYGLGWHVESAKGNRRVWHGGSLPGFSAYFARFVDEGVTIAALTNGEDVDLPSIGNGVAALYLPASAGR